MKITEEQVGKVMWWLYRKAHQWSTARGVVGIIAAIWIYQLHPNTIESVMAAATGLIALINIIRDENKKDNKNG